MRYLSYQIIFFLLTVSILAQSPHGDEFEIDCSECHSLDSWKIDLTKISFDHSKTNFQLIGQHINIDCKSCHKTLAFSKMDGGCISCHKDIHQATVGYDCAKCHTPTTWIVKDVVGLHQKGRFPLVGAHKLADCAQCHSGFSQLNFEPLNVDCYACHIQNYNSTQNPNHLNANFSKDCQDCHNVSSLSWTSTNIDHSFFPLTGGHALPSCFSCHQQGGNYSGLSPDCYSCHATDYNNTTNPNHQSVSFPTTCVDCHSTAAWQPATFNHDNQYFPIYSGTHQDKWTQCSECHTTSNNYSLFSCIACHEHNRTDTDAKHQGVQGYNYNSADCFACHPQGRKEGAFNHVTSSFPLTGVHLTASCSDCHQSGYTGTSSLCSDCHITAYNSAVNPNHQSLSISTDCASCHSTNANWQPAQFPQHNQYYELLGTHLEIINDCNSCHNGIYNNTPNQCVNCHQQNYNTAVNPNHSAAGLSTDCSTCHNANGWSPSTFNHTTTGFTLLGAHQPLQCSSCHIGTTSGLTSDCVSCHLSNYNSAPNHTSQSFPTNCELCHNSVAWNQVTFNHQNTSFPLTGAHTTTTCQSCHQNGYTNTPTDCYACHTDDYNNTTNPNHAAASFPTTCVECHSTTAWQPATFDHDNQYFPIYSGRHNGQWTQCSECHTTPNNYSLFSCIDCHEHNRTDTDAQHLGVIGYVYNSLNCFDCHPDGENRPVFNHTLTDFPLTGAHLNVECSQCHTSNIERVSIECVDCHIQDYLKSISPNHQAKSISTDCISCHTTSNWNASVKILEDSKVF